MFDKYIRFNNGESLQTVHAVFDNEMSYTVVIYIDIM